MPLAYGPDYRCRPLPYGPGHHSNAVPFVHIHKDSCIYVHAYSRQLFPYGPVLIHDDYSHTVLFIFMLIIPIQSYSYSCRSPPCRIHDSPADHVGSVLIFILMRGKPFASLPPFLFVCLFFENFPTPTCSRRHQSRCDEVSVDKERKCKVNMVLNVHRNHKAY